MTYQPPFWILIKIHSKPAVIKVLAGWNGGYLDGSSWRLNSGVKEVEYDGDNILFHGYSGSTYICHKDNRGVNGASAGAFEWLKKEIKEKFGYEVTVIEDITNEDSIYVRPPSGVRT